ncbi:SDR family oxidoreductase [Candidatus Micrarchaeota archaeon]|nr:SDR family oxidoreductase [Candidatus Micrarchaeota archaeon]
MEEHESLRKTVTFITGGAGDIGGATAELFAKEGSHVIIADVNDAAGKKLEGKLRRKGLAATFMHMDVRNESEVERVMNEVGRKFRKIDHLLNIAGGALPEEQKRLDMSVQTFRDSLELNLVGPFTVTKHAFPLLKKGTNPTVVNTSTYNAAMAVGNPAYTSAKAGLEGLTRYLASHLADHGIRVNAVAPGAVPTKRVIALYGGRKNELEKNPVFKELKRRTPMPRFGKPEDIAQAFLSAVKLKFMTGHVLRVDGGASSGRHVV